MFLVKYQKKKKKEIQKKMLKREKAYSFSSTGAYSHDGEGH